MIRTKTVIIENTECTNLLFSTIYDSSKSCLKGLYGILVEVDLFCLGWNIISNTHNYMNVLIEFTRPWYGD